MTPEERATAVFNELERKGIQPLNDNDWMNPEDKEAIIQPFADAICAAVLEEREQCAKIAERIGDVYNVGYGIAVDIRARSYEWIRRMAEKEDGKCISTGGLIARLQSKSEVLRTKAQVLAERGTVHGCCDRYANQQACDCLEKAV